MEQFWRKKTFKVLLVKWNKKLEDTGFEDCEVELEKDRVLKQGSATRHYKDLTQFERDSNLEYFYFLGHLANNTVFPNELEKIIMLKHSEGATVNEIIESAKLKKLSVCKKTVRYIIRRWQMKWGIRSWSLRQMNLKKSIG